MTPPLEQIKAACIAANPSIENCEINTRHNKGKLQNIVGWEPRPITLEDVLLAIENQGFVRGMVGEKIDIKLLPGETMQHAKQRAYQRKDEWISEVNLSDPCKRIILRWSLGKSLDQQSPETLEFIATVLK